jgi:hypothetical protein
MEKLSQDSDYKDYLKKLAPLITSRENGMMLEFSFWQTSPPKVTNGIFELRKYNLKVCVYTLWVVVASYSPLFI